MTSMCLSAFLRFYLSFLISRSEIGIGESNTVNDNDTSPQVLYDLFATANHTGTLHQGHYVANVKVGSDWYHCNDQMVSRYDEKDVLHSEGAYVLFYIRR
jgi:ubiquitin carboxyl-terminal hydrolase 22/27/51